MKAYFVLHKFCKWIFIRGFCRILKTHFVTHCDIFMIKFSRHTQRSIIISQFPVEYSMSCLWVVWFTVAQATTCRNLCQHVEVDNSAIISPKMNLQDIFCTKTLWSFKASTGVKISIFGRKIREEWVMRLWIRKWTFNPLLLPPIMWLFSVYYEAHIMFLLMFMEEIVTINHISMERV